MPTDHTTAPLQRIRRSWQAFGSAVLNTFSGSGSWSRSFRLFHGLTHPLQPSTRTNPPRARNASLNFERPASRNYPLPTPCSVRLAGLFFLINTAFLGLRPAVLSAGPLEQARTLHDRLTGVPPSTAVLTAMAEDITNGNAMAAARRAMDHPLFYRTTLKNFAAPWSDPSQSTLTPLNDMTATIIGMIRDDIPFNQVLSADLIYIGAEGVVAAPYSFADNTHYEQLESQYVDLSDPGLLVGVAQSSLPGTPLQPGETAGVLTTRAFAAGFLSAGTNRRAVRFALLNFLCNDLESLSDTSRPPDRVRQDVSRSPGGDSSVYLNYCVGCHAGLDALAGAFAYYDFDETTNRPVFTRDQVQPKYLINSNTFRPGYVTVDDSWINPWRNGQNAALGWSPGSGTGNGVKSFGEELAATRAFAQCQSQRVFRFVCLRSPDSADDVAAITRFTDVFITNNYNMKRLFAEAAVYCMGP